MSNHDLDDVLEAREGETSSPSPFTLVFFLWFHDDSVPWPYQCGVHCSYYVQAVTSINPKVFASGMEKYLKKVHSFLQVCTTQVAGISGRYAKWSHVKWNYVWAFFAMSLFSSFVILLAATKLTSQFWWVGRGVQFACKGCWWDYWVWS